MGVLAPNDRNAAAMIGDVGTRFNITDMGPMREFLGMEIIRDALANTITISQASYVRSILERFGMAESHAVATPLDTNVKLSKAETQSTIKYPYQEAIGSLMWLAVISRPDIAFAVQTLAQFSGNANEEHWTAVKRLLRYVKGTQKLGLVFGKSNTLSVTGYSDADWGQNISDRKSVSGYVFQIGQTAISWSSKRQPTVALSSMEAEYMALAHAVKEALWLKTLITEITQDTSARPIRVHCDNQSAIAFAHDDQFHARSKYIDIRYHFIRGAIIDRNIDVSYVESESNHADLLTKALTCFPFEKQHAAIGLHVEGEC